MTFQDAVDEIISAIRRKDLSVFCGAGISCNSGLPLVFNLLNYMFGKLELTSTQIDLIFESNLPFESIMESVLKESDLDDITSLFEEGKPNADHIFLARLAATGHLKIICTTNFDTLIEDALQDVGMEPHKQFKVHSTEDDLKWINWDSDCVHLIKIHGCVTQPNEMAITMQLMASAKYTETRKEILRRIFGGNGPKTVLVMGYSCSDLDLIPLIESFEKSTAEVFFVEHQSGFQYNPICMPISIKAVKNPFKRYSGYRLLINTDDFIKVMCNPMTKYILARSIL